MSTMSSPGSHAGIPEGYCAIPINELEAGAAVKLCVLAKQAADAGAGQLILLRDLPDAMVYLGCLVDAGELVREWTEIWVQNVDGLESSLTGLRESFSNHSMDQRWAGMAKAFASLHPGGLIRTIWENQHPHPAFLDITRKVVIHPVTGDKRWELCTEDTALQAAGLPAYSTSLYRYWYQSGSTERGFVPVVVGAPTNPSTHSLDEVLNAAPDRVPLNPQGGLLMTRLHCPLAYEDYIDLLSGKPWKGIEHGKRLMTFNSLYASLGDWTQMQQSGSHLFLGSQGRAGRFVEAFHLKLRAFMDAVNAVREFVAQQQLPFLNLGSDSFGVRLHEVGTRLPFLWTAECELVKPSEAFALPVESSDLKYFIRTRRSGAPIYQPENVSVASQGSGSVRIRTVLPPDQGRTLLEATLVVAEGVNISPHDLLWVRVPLPIGRVDLYGHLYSADGLAQGEARFRTVAQSLAADVVSALRAAEGLSFPKAPFEVVPLMSTPCDLYALGVLAVRTFLVNPQTTLAVALDEALSLARTVAADYKPDVPLHSRIEEIMNREPRFAKSLAPNRLVQEVVEPMTAFELLPPEIWYHTLATIIRFFPGVGPDSYCKDYGDAPALALEVVFNKPLEELEGLLIRSRSLIVIDWSANREVHSAIRDIADRHHV